MKHTFFVKGTLEKRTPKANMGKSGEIFNCTVWCYGWDVIAEVKECVDKDNKFTVDIDQIINLDPHDGCE